MTTNTVKPAVDDKAPSTRVQPARFPWYKAVAVLAWVLGTSTTYLLITQLVPEQPGWASAVEALIVQVLLTALESPVWKGKAGLVNIAAVVLDTLANAGGIYPFAERIGLTPPAQMFVSAFHLNGSISPIVAVGLALLLGYVLAAGPEAIWRWE